VNPAIPKGITAASLPPAIITSKYPSLIALKASPILFAALAHAVTLLIATPLNPYSIAMFPAARLIIDAGIKNGLNLSYPLSLALSSCSAMVLSPPIPLA